MITLYTDHKKLWVKHGTHQKAESLRAVSLSKLDNMVSNNSIFNEKCAEFSTKWKELLNCHNPTCAHNHPYNLHQKIHSSTSATLHLPIASTKTSLQSPLTLSFSIPQQFFTSLFWHTAIPTI